MSRHSGKAAVVTGAAQGIGRAICDRLRADGASVVAVDIQEIEPEPGLLPVRADISEEAGCVRAIEACIQEYGRIDILAAHAGIAEPRAFSEMDSTHWRRHQSINVDGAFYCALHAAKHMERGASIICTASINGFFVEETMTSYNVTKGALLTLVRSLAIDLGKRGIRANGVAPGVVDTPIAALVVHNPELAPHYLKSIPLGRFGQPEDIANAVSWLASEESSYITGQTIVIDGGQTLGIPGDMT